MNLETLEENIYKFSEKLERVAKRRPKGKTRKALMLAVASLVKASTALVVEDMAKHPTANPPKTLKQAWVDAWKN